MRGTQGDAEAEVRFAGTIVKLQDGAELWGGLVEFALGEERTTEQEVTSASRPN
jgi:hypothetical protein